MRMDWSVWRMEEVKGCTDEERILEKIIRFRRTSEKGREELLSIRMNSEK